MKTFGHRICNLMEIGRYILVFVGFYLANTTNNPETQLITISSFCVIGIAGLTGIEGFFFGKYSSEIVGYQANSRYQKQSALNNISLATSSLIGVIGGFGVMYHLALLFVLLIFLFLSAANHMVDIFVAGNKNMRNFLRPIITLLLIVVSAKYILHIL